jgi:hypothetical protein
MADKWLVTKIYENLLKFIRKQTAQLKNGQKIWTDILLKKRHRWPISIWKDAQHHLSLGKCKLKQQNHHNQYFLIVKWLKSEDTEHLHPSLMQMHNVQSHWKIVLPVLTRLTSLPYKHSSHAPRYLPTDSKSYIHSKPSMQMFIVSLFIIIKTRSNQDSFNRSIDNKLWNTHPMEYSSVMKEMSYGVMQRYKWSLNACPKWKKPAWERLCMIRFHLYGIWKRQNDRDGKQISGCQCCGVGGVEKGLNRWSADFSGWWE